ncbi:unnamed protein product [Pleuronectes platessa]|uniref:Uncharacterized protein n=1 Tax=Pleuronectes platessa TaxID=8262 RepID=A0A9N7VBA8_PLEPL|nr:unnamed protein product [Pleuronectes platessa]
MLGTCPACTCLSSDKPTIPRPRSTQGVALGDASAVTLTCTCTQAGGEASVPCPCTKAGGDVSVPCSPCPPSGERPTLAAPVLCPPSPHSVFPVAIRSRQAEKIDSTPKRSLHGATLQPPVCSALRFNMGVDGSQRIGAALTPRFGVASASGVNPA